MASHVAPVVKNLPANAGNTRDVGSIPESGRSLEEEMATHSSILFWRIPWHISKDHIVSTPLQLKTHYIVYFKYIKFSSVILQ